MVVTMIMVVLALLGVGLTTAKAVIAPKFWLWLVPTYGVLCIVTAWSRAAHSAESNWILVFRQLMHWLIIAGALGLDFYIRGTGEESGTATGLNALLLLSLGCFMAGVHLDWLFAVVGVLLTLTLICVAKADQYLWLIFLVGGVAIVAMIGVMKLLSAARSGKHAAQKAPQSAPAAS